MLITNDSAILCQHFLEMLRTVASPGTFGCLDYLFLHKCTEVTDKADTHDGSWFTLPTSLLRFCASEGRSLTSLHWQGVARATRSQRPLLRGESSGPQITPFWPKGVIGKSPVNMSKKFCGKKIFFPQKSQKTAQKLYQKNREFFGFGFRNLAKKGRI